MHGPEGIGLLNAIFLVVHVYARSWTHGDGSGKGLCRTVFKVEGRRKREVVRDGEIEFTRNTDKEKREKRPCLMR